MAPLVELYGVGGQYWDIFWGETCTLRDTVHPRRYRGTQRLDDASRASMLQLKSAVRDQPVYIIGPLALPLKRSVSFGVTRVLETIIFSIGNTDY